MAYEVNPRHTSHSTRRPQYRGGDLNGRYPLLHLHRQRRHDSPRQRYLWNGFHRVASRLQNVEVEPQMSPLRRNIQGAPCTTPTPAFGKGAVPVAVDLTRNKQRRKACLGTPGIPQELERKLSRMSFRAPMFSRDVSQMMIELVNNHVGVVQTLFPRNVDCPIPVDIAS